MKKHLFFDLDRTLWDFETNSHETLLEICERYKLKEIGVSNYEEFIKIYKKINTELWNLYRINKISQKNLRRERFQKSLEHFGVKDYILSENIGEYYINICPRKTKLLPYAHKVLDYLQHKYTLHIITNGFDKTQHIKLDCSKLTSYFQQIITSEKTGFKKPNPLIFYHALKLSQAIIEESVYIGDNLEIDIVGCQNTGIDGVYFNPEIIKHNEKPKHEIQCLSQLMKIF